jgi:two-component SAPR family response regulator
MRILCLDDEPLALRMLEQAVRQSKPDADISAYLDQDELLEQTKQGGCDIAFLDIHMRGMNGVELAKKLKEVNPKINIIFVTGFSEYTGEAMQTATTQQHLSAHSLSARHSVSLMTRAAR